jgi:hypothetical protein
MRPGEDLLEQLEAARVGGPHLDWKIANTYPERCWIEVDETGTNPTQVWGTSDGAKHRTLPAFTTSLDAALRLCDNVPEMVPSNPLVVCRQAIRTLKEQALRILPE